MQQLMVCIGSFSFRKALFLVSRTNFGFPYYIRQEKTAFITLFGNFLCKQTVNNRQKLSLSCPINTSAAGDTEFP